MIPPADIRLPVFVKKLAYKLIPQLVKNSLQLSRILAELFLNLSASWNPLT